MSGWSRSTLDRHPDQGDSPDGSASGAAYGVLVGLPGGPRRRNAAGVQVDGRHHLMGCHLTLRDPSGLRWTTTCFIPQRIREAVDRGMLHAGSGRPRHQCRRPGVVTSAAVVMGGVSRSRHDWSIARFKADGHRPGPWPCSRPPHDIRGVPVAGEQRRSATGTGTAQVACGAKVEHEPKLVPAPAAGVTATARGAQASVQRVILDRAGHGAHRSSRRTLGAVTRQLFVQAPRTP